MIRTIDSRCRDVLLRNDLSDSTVRELLLPVGFADWCAAHRCLRRIASSASQKTALVEMLPHLLTTLSGAADPDGVLVNLERFAGCTPDRTELLSYLAGNPRSIEILVTLFAGSQFLTEILLINPDFFSRLSNPKSLAVLKTQQQISSEANAVAAQADTFASQLDALRRFQRLELLRIGVCDLLGLFDLPAVTTQLSSLADSLVQACLNAAAQETETPLDSFVVIAMGKLGGSELNYSSDIDLLFLSRSNATEYWRLGRKLIDALGKATGKGFLYRIDMRLRPWGEAGALVTSVDACLAYLEKHARLWEKQALLKARVTAGDETVGNDFLRRAEPLLFGSSAEAARSQVYAMKERTEGILRRQGLEGREVKLGEGSIRDIEFVTQYLQLVHGALQPAIRSRQTLDALLRLSCYGLLPEDEYRVLADGYVFLRTIEHHLQMMHYRQTHLLPEDPEALSQLARRLGFTGPGAGGQFSTRYQEHSAAIRAVYLRHLGIERKERAISSAISTASPQIRAHVARMDPTYTAAFSEEEIHQHALLAERLSDDSLVEVEAIPLDETRWRVTVVGFDYPGELSVICGLLFASGFSIQDGNVFTYEPVETQVASPQSPPYRSMASLGFQEGFSQRRRAVPGPRSSKRKIVDVFTVRAMRPEVPPGVWKRYAVDLSALLRLMQEGKHREARGEVAKRAAVTLQESSRAPAKLYPVDIEIDNVSSEKYTVLRIESKDTLGFLYELTNALALGDIYIARVTCESAGNRLHDILWVSDLQGKKITAPEKQQELRSATVLIKHFTHLLPRSPNPESALLHFGELVTRLFSRPDWASELASLERPKVLDAVAQLLGVSDFLWDDFLRMQHENLFPVVSEVEELAIVKTAPQLKEELEAALEVARGIPDPVAARESWRTALNAFKDRELFRIDMRHILGQTLEFSEFSEELTVLAEVIVEATYRMSALELLAQFGEPELEDGQPCPLSVCALGKCGGRELGFASDIELMFIYGGNGRTRGDHAITTAEFFERLARVFAGAIRAKREGIFEVDLRLRPYGKAGSMAVSLDAFKRYFAPQGPAWAYERQSLVKLRPIAGDLELGRQIVALRDDFVYNGEAFDVTAMRAMRERQIRHLVKAGTQNAKYSPGGLADIEYLVQALQIKQGFRDPGVRVANTRGAMAALAAAGVLSQTDYARVRKAHTFLRWLIDALRVVRGSAKDVTVPPFGSEEFAFLARRLRYGGDVVRLKEEFSSYTASVQELNARLLG